MIWLIYLLEFVDKAQFAAKFATATCFIASVVLTAVWIGMKIDSFPDDRVKPVTKKRNMAYLFLIISTSLSIAIPSSKTIAAVYLVPRIAENEQLQEIPNKALKLLNGKLDEWIEGISETRENE